jgi:hypothetical protein
MKKFTKKEMKDKPMDEDHSVLEALKVQARDYIKKNNTLVQQLWDIDRKLLDTKDEAEKGALCSHREQLRKTLEDEGYEIKIPALLDKIKALELKLDGHSNIGSSPYVL